MRSPAWLKLKPKLTLDVVVTGGSAERFRRGEWGEAVMLAFRYTHPRTGADVEDPPGSARAPGSSLRPQDRRALALVCWGVMPSGMLGTRRWPASGRQLIPPARRVPAIHLGNRMNSYAMPAASRPYRCSWQIMRARPTPVQPLVAVTHDAGTITADSPLPCTLDDACGRAHDRGESRARARRRWPSTQRGGKP